jgi:hypothetical protein
MFVEETNKIFVVEDNRVVESFVKQAYYGSCPHPDCEEHGATKYDIKKNENCKSCNTSMKVEFPKGKTPKKDSEDKDTSSDKDENMTTSSKASYMNQEEKVEAYRVERLEAMGFNSEDCVDLAKNSNVDLHQAENMINDGATLDQVKRILSKVAAEEAPSMSSDEEEEAFDGDVEEDAEEDIVSKKKMKASVSDKIAREEAMNCKSCDKFKFDVDDESGNCKDCAKEAEAGKDYLNDQSAKREKNPGGYDAETKQLGKGSRVSHREKEGTVISMVPGIYGDTFGVKFDDGKVAEFLSEQLTAVESEKTIYLSSIEEIVSDHIEYDLAPANTLDELEGKTRIARSLNLRAKGLIVGSKISMNERVQLDNIITSTSADIRDFNEGTNHLQEIEAEAYLARSPKYKINDEFIGWGSQARTKTDEDISWLNDVDTEFDITSDPKLIAIAANSVSSLTREQLEDADFMKEVHYYSALNLPAEASPRLASFMKEAAKMRLEEPIQSIAKQASVESFDDVDDAALYM